MPIMAAVFNIHSGVFDIYGREKWLPSKSAVHPIKAASAGNQPAFKASTKSLMLGMSVNLKNLIGSI